MNKPLLILGLLVTLIVAMLLLFGVISFGVSAAACMLGIGLIVLSRWVEQEKPETTPSAQVVQTIHSADGELRAVIKQRIDGKYQVEIQRFVREDSPEFGPNDHWVRQSAPITDTLSSAVDIAASYVGARE
jgi:hypothetical protein